MLRSDEPTRMSVTAEEPLMVFFVFLLIIFCVSYIYSHQGSYPDELKSAANSIVCTSGGLLLRELFNMTPGIERPVSFPSKHCNAATARCDQCLEHDSCGTITGETLIAGYCLMGRHNGI
jgi:hypothetical protein